MAKSTKSTTKYLDFDGIVAWCRVYPGQEDEYNGIKNWKMNFYPDVETIAKMKAAGIQLRLKEDDGEKSGVSGKYFTLKRPLEKEFSDGIQKFLPAEITFAQTGEVVKYKINADGTDFNMVGDKIVIGNGSKVRVTLECYQTKRFGVGTRLQKIKVLDLVEYVAPEDVSENEVDGDDDTPFETDVTTTQGIPDEAELVTKKSKKVKW